MTFSMWKVWEPLVQSILYQTKLNRKEPRISRNAPFELTHYVDQQARSVAYSHTPMSKSNSIDSNGAAGEAFAHEQKSYQFICCFWVSLCTPALCLLAPKTPRVDGQCFPGSFTPSLHVIPATRVVCWKIHETLRRADWVLYLHGLLTCQLAFTSCPHKTLTEMTANSSSLGFTAT